MHTTLAANARQARISFDDGPGFVCWHTDCYRLRDETWQVAWSQARVTGRTQ
jgi:hypothetical protein